MKKAKLFTQHYITLYLFLFFSHMSFSIISLIISFEITLYAMPFYIPIIVFLIFVSIRSGEKLGAFFFALIMVGGLFLYGFVKPMFTIFNLNNLIGYNYVGVSAGNYSLDRNGDEYLVFKEKYLLKKDDKRVTPILERLYDKYDDIIKEDYMYIETASIMDYDLRYIKNITENKISSSKFLISGYSMLEYVIVSVFYSLSVVVFIVINLLFSRKKLFFGKNLEPITILLFPSFEIKSYN